MLSWKTGNTEPQFLTKGQTQSKCTSLAFLLFGLQQKKDECLMVEDGHALRITQAA
jgi:hypothetical protein